MGDGELIENLVRRPSAVRLRTFVALIVAPGDAASRD